MPCHRALGILTTVSTSAKWSPSYCPDPNAQ
jgi:hypothetical protein